MANRRDLSDADLRFAVAAKRHATPQGWAEERQQDKVIGPISLTGVKGTSCTIIDIQVATD